MENLNNMPVNYRDISFLAGITALEAKGIIAGMLRIDVCDIRISDEVKIGEVPYMNTQSSDARYHDKNILLLAAAGLKQKMGIDLMIEVAKHDYSIKKGRPSGKFLPLRKFANEEDLARLENSLKRQQEQNKY